MGERLAALQDRLYAASSKRDRRGLLLVLQGTDTSGKGAAQAHAAEMLAQLLLELAEVEGHSTERQTTSVQIRLTEMTAMLAALIADSLMKLGDDRGSRGWYETARRAAEESGNLELRASPLSGDGSSTVDVHRGAG
ncbi:MULTISPECIES: hypothetical protein [unclassified Streptomyces]|uniref:hypothetical protein n=1 Tax=unclassified Streptomyces TaxID=2593676 RepID=UPI00386C2277